MFIGELARQVGVNPRTVRYYESIGLLPRSERSPAGYRRYGPEDVERVAFIRRATELGLRLDEVAEVLALRDGDQRPCGYVVSVARQRLDELDRRIAEMRRSRDELERLLERAAQLPGDGDGYCHLIGRRPG